MPIQNSMYLIGRAAVIIGNGALGLAKDQVAVLMVHSANLPLAFRFARATAGVVNSDAQMTDQLRLPR
jgi:hypothetical protein